MSNETLEIIAEDYLFPIGAALVVFELLIVLAGFSYVMGWQ